MFSNNVKLIYFDPRYEFFDNERPNGESNIAPVGFQIFSK